VRRSTTDRSRVPSICAMADTSSTPSRASSESENDRRPNRRVGLFGATIGLIGIVVGGVIAAASSYYTTKVQVHSQAVQARQEFLRSQQQATYSKFAGDEAVNRTFFVRCRSRLAQPDFTASESDVTALEQATDNIRNLIAADAGTVYFVGSAETSTIGFDIFTDFKEMIGYCISGTKDHLEGSSPNPDDPKVLSAAISHERDDLARFLIAGRRDLRD
jgi:hypothetical protein